MKKRIGKDFDAVISVQHDGEPINFSQYEVLWVSIDTAYRRTKLKPGTWTTAGRLITAHIPRNLISIAGEHWFTVAYRKPDASIEDGYYDFEDNSESFQIVGKTEDEDAGDLTAKVELLAGLTGKAFKYEDFTPEQLSEIKRPIVESAERADLAIAEIKSDATAFLTNSENILSAQLADNDNKVNQKLLGVDSLVSEKTSEINEKINQTDTAIQNANTVTQNANEAAGLANNAALLANEKAGLAATATTEANTARDEANSAAQVATDLVNSYATDLAAKELKDNKQNSLAPDGTGTKFPTVDAVNEGLQPKLVSGTNIKTVNGISLLGSGDVSNLITTYTHTSNTVIQPTALDPVTGIFTCNNHGLIQNKGISWNLNRNHNLLPYQVIPVEINGGLYGAYYVDVVDANSFKIKKDTTSPPLTYASAGDITKWHFEANAVSGVTITNLPAYKKLKVITKFISNANVWFQGYPSNVGGTTNNWYIGGAIANAHAATINIFGFNMPAYTESYFDFSDISTIRHKLYGFIHVHTSPTTVTKNTPVDLCWINFDNLGALTITDLMIGSPSRALLNGTTVEIYNL